MSTIATPSTSMTATQVRAGHPSFFGIVGGELLKISRMWLTWIMGVLLLGTMVLPYLFTLNSVDSKASLLNNPLHFLYNETQVNLSVFRVFVGFFLIILTAYVIGQEFQYGTIRILLARGLGRIQLLLAKVVAIVVIALILFVIAVAVHAILITSLIAFLAGNLHAFNAITSAFWTNTWLYVLTVLISMGVTILMATAASVLGRSLAFGMSVGVAWFAVDNIGSQFMILFYSFTKSKFWMDITAYFLGPNLNTMPAQVLPASLQAKSIGIVPLVNVDGPHTLWVALVYAVIFAVAALVLIWKRDVQE